MLQRLNVREGQTAEDARKVFDAQLGVGGWGTPSSDMRPVEARDPSAPWWWHGDEDASQSFLTAMGVNLDG